MAEGAGSGSPLSGSLGDGAGVVTSPLAGVRTSPEEDDGDGVGEVARPSPDFGPGESDGLSGEGESEVAAGFDGPPPPVTAPLTVVPEPPLKLLPATSS
ncbi:hypothetical protein [Streptomyces sp. NPDC001068]|uniref:hypothetical protein n=1 Tax=Streptomyces sp. NPDC001068 TaxID=3364544 RepID=UPI00369337F9